MDNQNSVVKTQAPLKAQPKPKKMPPQQSQVPGGPEVWDGNSSGWTLVSYSRKKKTKK